MIKKKCGNRDSPLGKGTLDPLTRETWTSLRWELGTNRTRRRLPNPNSI